MMDREHEAGRASRVEGPGYWDDFHAWTIDQASRLRAAAASGSNLPLDWEHLAEEIESVGRSDYRALESHLAIIIEHLLKLEHSPAPYPRSGWEDSVSRSRDQAIAITRDSPSLRGRLSQALEDAWPGAARIARRGLAKDRLPPETVPEACPYTVERALDPDWWPENRHGLG